MIATGVVRKDSMTVSQKSAYWVTPPDIQSVPYAPLKEIDFVGKKRLNLPIMTVMGQGAIKINSLLKKKTT